MQWRPQVGHAVRHMSGAAKESGGSATPLIGLGLALAAGGAGVYFLGAPPPDATEDIMSTTLPASILSKPLDVCFFLVGCGRSGAEGEGEEGGTRGVLLRPRFYWRWLPWFRKATLSTATDRPGPRGVSCCTQPAPPPSPPPPRLLSVPSSLTPSGLSLNMLVCCACTHTHTDDPKGYFTRAQAKASQLAKEQTADHKKNQTLFAAHAASAVPTQ